MTTSAFCSAILMSLLIILLLRQVEERRRVEEDEIWRQMCNCHQGTMETYLEDIIVRSVDRTADEQVRNHVVYRVRYFWGRVPDFHTT